MQPLYRKQPPTFESANFCHFHSEPVRSADKNKRSPIVGKSLIESVNFCHFNLGAPWAVLAALLVSRFVIAKALQNHPHVEFAERLNPLELEDLANWFDQS